MMKRVFFFVLFLCFFANNVISQVSEIGLAGGVSFYLGDLNQKGVFKNSQPAGGVVYRYNINPRWAFKSTVLFGSLTASDADASDAKTRERNLSFKSPIQELSAQIELNFMRLYNEVGQNFFTPYLFLGVSVFSFNPQAKYRGEWYDLQALGTEGQELNLSEADKAKVQFPEKYEKKRYSLIGVSIPFGLGMRFNFLKYYSVGLEWGMRKTFTDYIDDVSTTYAKQEILQNNRDHIVTYFADPSGGLYQEGQMRGDEKTKDWYSFAVLTFTFKLNYQQGCSVPSAASAKKKLKRK